MTIPQLKAKKQQNQKITMLTAYDVLLAQRVDAAGIDIVLVGDSLGMVELGYSSTRPVTMEEMLHHTKAVRRGVKKALLVGDMPFMSYQASKETAISNAGKFLKEAGCDAVKLEGGRESLEAIRAIVQVGIPVMGHLGLTPQTTTRFGGYKVQGREPADARRLVEEARFLEEAGCFALVLECVPASLAQKITRTVSIPVIGIGAGPHCDGQVLVTQDLLGLSGESTPQFVKRFAELGEATTTAIAQFKEEVEAGTYPDETHSYPDAPVRREKPAAFFNRLAEMFGLKKFS